LFHRACDRLFVKGTPPGMKGKRKKHQNGSLYHRVQIDAKGPSIPEPFRWRQERTAKEFDIVKGEEGEALPGGKNLRLRRKGGKLRTEPGRMVIYLRKKRKKQRNGLEEKKSATPSNKQERHKGHRTKGRGPIFRWEEETIDHIRHQGIRAAKNPPKKE